MSEEMSQQKVILNANTGITNVVEGKVIRRDLLKVTDKIFNILKDHYGPFSGFAAVDTRDALSETTFTKDGIGIVRALEFASPQEEWVRKTIAYIGTKMEAEVGDGTTSAMMFACAMLKAMIRRFALIKPISFGTLSGIFNDVISAVAEQIDDYKITPEELKENPKLRDLVVWHQVYTSSHGNKEIADAITALYANTPPELWDRMVYERSTIETENALEAIISEGQYQMKCEVMSNAMLLDDFGSKFDRKNCTVVIANDAVRVDGPLYFEIQKQIPLVTKDKPLVVISHKRMDNNTYIELTNELSSVSYSDRPIAFFQIDPSNPRVNDFINLQLLTGQDILKYRNGECVVVEGADVKYRKGTKELVLDKIYEEPEGYEGNERHHVKDGLHTEYVDYMNTLKQQASEMDKFDARFKDRDTITLFYRMYAKLKYKKSSVLRIGGKSYDNLALVDIVDDCMRAVSRALKNGVVPGNNKLLYLIVKKKIDSFYYSRHTRTSNRVKLWCYECIEEALKSIGYVVQEKIFEKRLGWFHRTSFESMWMNGMVDLTRVKPASISNGRFKDIYSDLFDDPIYIPTELFKRMIVEKTNFEREHCRLRPILQPANADISMLTRFAEVALKYVFAERIVVRNAAYVEEKKR